MNPSLLILAAGMGSRYGGIKQIEPLGLNGESILEYSIFDAIRSGFDRVVFVIREDIQKDFEELVLPKFASHIACDCVIQRLEDLPSGYNSTVQRKKPWGTAHAMLCARKAITSPFAVINADDFYGREAFSSMGKFLASVNVQEKRYAMVGYELSKTLSENGTVSRGICKVDEKNNLIAMVEHVKIGYKNAKIVSQHSDGSSEVLEANTPVSMNFFGFTPAIFPDTDAEFQVFLDSNLHNDKAEFFIPLVVNSIIHRDSTMQVLDTSASWFGITYQQDKEHVVSSIQNLIRQDLYPKTLW